MPPGATKSEKCVEQSVSQASEGKSPADILISDLQLPELHDNTFLLFKPLSLKYFLTAALGS